jgi:hypothetical protein
MALASADMFATARATSLRAAFTPNLWELASEGRPKFAQNGSSGPRGSPQVPQIAEAEPKRSLQHICNPGFGGLRASGLSD